MNKLKIEIAYAKPDQQCIVQFEVEEGCSMESAILQSGLCDMFPEIDLSQQKIGVFSKQCELTDTVKNGDRIEIYRPLIIDPKEKRRTRAQKKISKT